MKQMKPALPTKHETQPLVLPVVSNPLPDNPKPLTEPTPAPASEPAKPLPKPKKESRDVACQTDRSDYARLKARAADKAAQKRQQEELEMV